MDKQFKKEDQLLKDLISQAGLEQPGQDFKSNLMDLIEQKSAEKIRYKPLIGKKVWLFIAASLATIMVVIFLYPSKPFEKFGLSYNNDIINNIIPDMSASNTLVYGVLFLSLFIFQIPFLKKYLERANS